MSWWRKLFARRPQAATVQSLTPPAFIPPTAERQLCYIEFQVANAQALERLTAIVEAFKADKAEEEGRSEEEWTSVFLPDELDTFWRPDEQEYEAWNTYWFSTPLPKRHSSEMPSPPWHFGSMLEAILENGDYDLIGVRPLMEGKARLEFDPHSYPYGGTGALRALIRAFGHCIVGGDDGTGYEMGDPQPLRWMPEMQIAP